MASWFLPMVSPGCVFETGGCGGIANGVRRQRSVKTKDLFYFNVRMIMMDSKSKINGLRRVNSVLLSYLVRFRLEIDFARLN